MVLAKRERTIDRSISDNAVKQVVRKATGKKETVADVQSFTTIQVKVWTAIDGVLNQTGEYRGKRFKGAADHTPEANLAILDTNLASGAMPDIVD